ncbi:hypothetical protein EV385_5334 [Krasilnikovia cinnamomea]|uniref:Uncharacterized protein n=1 Tax=Krasilnikovia cinnamomea TaxID=349313 RepID=A0A4Q7ZSF8_9ACTN|nr:hypothetical protein [Krasilnikovia cinnamomea]RZU53409.1 hypothetical protein EV385_5334 [Krasilnikovia cinnamomea]
MHTTEDLRAALQNPHTVSEPNIAAIVARGRRRRRARRILGAATALLVVGAAAAAPNLVSGLRRPASAHTAADTQQHSTDNRFHYYRSIGYRQDSPGSPRCGYVHEAWYPFDSRQPGRAVLADGVVLPAPDWAGDPRALAAQPRCSYKVQETDRLMQGTTGMPGMPENRGSWGQPSKEFIAALPDTPEALLQHAVTAVVNDPVNQQQRKSLTDPSSNLRYVYAFGSLADLISSDYPDVTPQVQATTLQAMLLIPGVRKDSSMKDLLGRTGIGLVGPAEKGESPRDVVTYIIDPQTGQYLGASYTGGRSASTSTTVDDTTTRPGE